MTRLSRRRFLRGTCGLTLSLPFLPSLMGEAYAAGPAPKRFIFIFTANGVPAPIFYPSAATFTTLSASQFVREAPFATASGISQVLGPEFDTLKPKLTLVRGLDHLQLKGLGHDPQSTLSGYLGTGPSAPRQGPTIDQILAQSSKVYPVAPPVRSVHMLVTRAAEGTGPGNGVSATAALQAVPMQKKVSVTYTRLFGGFSPMADPTAEQRAALRTTIMDRLRGDYQQLHDNPRLGSEDRVRLEAHVANLQDLQARINSVSTVTCTKPGVPVDPDPVQEASTPILTGLNVDLLVNAIKCDRTRVATLMLSPGTDLCGFSFIGGVGQHHGLSHSGQDPVAQQKLAKINNWYAKQVADLLKKLDVVEDPMTGRTYLDNSLVYWGNEDGANVGPGTHEPKGKPCLLAGSCGGYLKTGRYLDYRHFNGTAGVKRLYNYNGTPIPTPGGWELLGRAYNSLLISILQGMGLEPADYEAPGKPGFGDYSENYQNQYSVTEGQGPLPFLKA